MEYFLNINSLYTDGIFAQKFLSNISITGGVMLFGTKGQRYVSSSSALQLGISPDKEFMFIPKVIGSLCFVSK